jgi:hypothetical protein
MPITDPGVSGGRGQAAGGCSAQANRLNVR